MASRMMCTLCFETAEPETRLQGSDLAEIVGWLCFVVPGWLYCLWRHILRSKICSRCGGESLIREARAVQARFAPSSVRARIRSASGPSRWPHALTNPRDRLVHGGTAVLLIGSVAFAPGATWLIPAFASWMAFEIARVFQIKAPAIAAWDDQGRPMRIEVV